MKKLTTTQALMVLGAITFSLPSTKVVGYKNSTYTTTKGTELKFKEPILLETTKVVRSIPLTATQVAESDGKFRTGNSLAMVISRETYHRHIEDLAYTFSSSPSCATYPPYDDYVDEVGNILRKGIKTLFKEALRSDFA
jgi:hypothetical protein